MELPTNHIEDFINSFLINIDIKELGQGLRDQLATIIINKI